MILVKWPLESGLSQGHFSPDPMARLLRTDWLRKLLLVEAPLAVFMAHRVLRAAGAGGNPAGRRGPAYFCAAPFARAPPRSSPPAFA